MICNILMTEKETCENRTDVLDSWFKLYDFGDRR